MFTAVALLGTVERLMSDKMYTNRWFVCRDSCKVCFI